jgi:hypothetical protein
MKRNLGAEISNLPGGLPIQDAELLMSEMQALQQELDNYVLENDRLKL